MKRFFLLPLLLLGLISCNESGLGIFYNISREQPLKDATLPNGLSVSGMVKGTEKYYVCAGGLFSRDISSVESAPWDDETRMPTDVYAHCLALVEFKDSFYGLFSNIEATSTAIYRTPRDKIDWIPVGSFDNPLVALTASDTYLFVTERTDYATYTTMATESADGTGPWITLAIAPPTGVTDAVDFLSNTWLMSGSYLYSGSGSTYTQISPSGEQSSARFGGLFVSDALGRLFVSNSAGYVYATADGSSWHDAFVTDTAGDPVKLYDFEEVSILGAQVIVVGAENGYYDIIFEDGAYASSFSLQIPGSQEAGDYSSSDANFLNIDLRRSVVRMFFFDEANSTLFAGTSGNGLWVNPISGSTLQTITRKWDRQ